MDNVKSALGAIGWLLLFAASAIIAGIGSVMLAIITKEPFLINGITAYYTLVNDLSSGVNPADIPAEQLVTAANFGLLATFVSYLPVLIVALVTRKHKHIPFRKPRARTLLFCVALAAIWNLILEFGTALAIPFLPHSDTDAFNAVTTLATQGSPWIVILIAGIAGPIAEEVILRRGVQRSLQAINPIFAILTASVLFGLIHGNLIQGVFAGAIGLALGYVYYKTDNLIYPITMHVTVNLSACLITAFDLPEFPAFLTIAGLALFAVTMWPDEKSPIYPASPAAYEANHAKELADKEARKQAKADLF